MTKERQSDWMEEPAGYVDRDISVLALWNTAGCPQKIAKEINKSQRNMHIDVLYNSRVNNGIGFEQSDSVKNIPYLYNYSTGSSFRWVIKAFEMAKSYDVVWLNSLPKLAKLFHMVYGDSKKLVMWLHGSEIKGKWDKWGEELVDCCDIVYVSSEDLLVDAPDSVVHLHRPVDREFFRALSDKELDEYNYERVWNSALSIHKNRNSPQAYIAKVIASLYNVQNLEQMYRDKPVPYKFIPYKMNCFDKYIDCNNPYHYEKHKVLSLTGLEALACGLTVLTPSVDEGSFLHVYNRFPPSNDSFSVAMDFYVDVVNLFEDWDI